MNNSVVTVQAVGKSYPLLDSPYDRMKYALARCLDVHDDKLRSLIGREKFFSALSDVSFEVGRGDSIGILGRNGAGKSTLLQIIAGVLMPSVGRVERNGKIGSLLELGSSFNTEFSGIENIQLAGSLAGISGKDLKRKIDDIISFSELGEWINRPIKQYSTGMLMRLAFSVQTAIEPDLLIVDEALSVGDDAFRRKCIARIETVRRNGTALLFVSHVPSQVAELCSKGIVLDRGRLVFSGIASDASTYYHKVLHPSPLDASRSLETHPKDDHYWDPELQSRSMERIGVGGCTISMPRLTDARSGRLVNLLQFGNRYIFSFEVDFSDSCVDVVISCNLKTVNGVYLSSGKATKVDSPLPKVKAGERTMVCFEFICNLSSGVFLLEGGVRGRVGDEVPILDAINDWYMVRVLENKDADFLSHFRFFDRCTMERK